MSSSTLDVRISRAWRSVWRHPFGGIGVSFHEPVALTPSGLRPGGDGRLLALQPPPFACPGAWLRKGDAEEPVSTGNCGARRRAPGRFIRGSYDWPIPNPTAPHPPGNRCLVVRCGKIEGMTNCGPQWSAMSTRRFLSSRWNRWDAASLATRSVAKAVPSLDIREKMYLNQRVDFSKSRTRRERQ